MNSSNDSNVVTHFFLEFSVSLDVTGPTELNEDNIPVNVREQLIQKGIELIANKKILPKIKKINEVIFEEQTGDDTHPRAICEGIFPDRPMGDTERKSTDINQSMQGEKQGQV
jgi:hypothetical protein